MRNLEKKTRTELKELGMEPHAIKAFLILQKKDIAVMTWDDDSRGHFWIWCEGITDETELNLEYYDNYFGSDKLNKILEDNGLYFEWYNSAQANVYDA